MGKCLSLKQRVQIVGLRSEYGLRLCEKKNADFVFLKESQATKKKIKLCRATLLKNQTSIDIFRTKTCKGTLGFKYTQ